MVDWTGQEQWISLEKVDYKQTVILEHYVCRGTCYSKTMDTKAQTKYCKDTEEKQPKCCGHVRDKKRTRMENCNPPLPLGNVGLSLQLLHVTQLSCTHAIAWKVIINLLHAFIIHNHNILAAFLHDL